MNDMTDDQMSIEEVIDHIMKNGYATSRRVARKMLMKAVKEGLPVYGRPILDDGGLGPVERIPPHIVEGN
jgi:hypothetical protein